MGLLTYMSCFSSKASSSARTTDCSTSMPKPGQHVSIRTFRALRAPLMLNNIWRKTETSLIMELSKSMEDQVEEVNNLPTMLMPKQSMQEIQHRRLIF
ncbi:C4 protein [Velvet bean golden mosaic virus]|uniref:C4 protein n=1 Tax=Velvet bean golden mosaic virus TaxID=1881630 RepID=A0A1B1UUF0_9GEMI|nr:C4 protein [Velvet bean golden mosaic virus]ANW06445.1 C4 protein [Velvet bean golden mosaic virus]ANW06451.1 C4 protein [Velvet bean golden mosaic virus]ANW06457.1 C4 protein [Velvet bean golden mosaic virus]ANW06463.1 C4 protein [Velvet bean golden mosaic virus]ANW06469.1 C4 protein [Velvet bean golden mosaic virus]